MSTGSELRDRREDAGLSIEALADATSIRGGLITEMEANNFKHCGGDTYARGHLKNIAMRLGLDPQHFVQMYNEEHSLDQRAIHDLLVENNIASIPQEEKTLSWKIPAAVSVLILVIAGTVQIISSNQSPDTNSKAVVASAEPSATSVPNESATATSTATATPTTQPTPTASASASQGTGEVTLSLSAVRGNSFINVVVDGTSVIKGSIFQGDVKTYKGSKSISLYLSNPAGIDVTYNGKLLPPLGGQNQEVRRTFK
jgi:cytoskeletal protein RodZ